MLIQSRKDAYNGVVELAPHGVLVHPSILYTGVIWGYSLKSGFGILPACGGIFFLIEEGLKPFILPSHLFKFFFLDSKGSIDYKFCDNALSKSDPIKNIRRILIKLFLSSHYDIGLISYSYKSNYYIKCIYIQYRIATILLLNIQNTHSLFLIFLLIVLPTNRAHVSLQWLRSQQVPLGFLVFQFRKLLKLRPHRYFWERDLEISPKILSDSFQNYIFLDVSELYHTCDFYYTAVLSYIG